MGEEPKLQNKNLKMKADFTYGILSFLFFTKRDCILSIKVPNKVCEHSEISLIFYPLIRTFDKLFKAYLYLSLNLKAIVFGGTAL